MTTKNPIIVTGASSGIGNATAERLLARGHRLVTLDVKPPQDAVKSKIVEHIACDLADPQSISTALTKIKGPIAALLNIAGVPDTGGAEKVMRVNILGLRQLTEGLWDRIETGGRIVNIASIAGNNWRKRRAGLVDLLATPDFAAGLAWWKANEASIGADAYTVSKEAVVVYTMQLAARGLARGIRANDVGPGPIDTPILPDFERMTGKEMMDAYIARVGRVGKPDDIAEAVVVLTEGQMGWLNGQHIIVDGGLTASFSAGLKKA